MFADQQGLKCFDDGLGDICYRPSNTTQCWVPHTLVRHVYGRISKRFLRSEKSFSFHHIFPNYDFISFVKHLVKNCSYNDVVEEKVCNRLENRKAYCYHIDQNIGWDPKEGAWCKFVSVCLSPNSSIVTAFPTSKCINGNPQHAPIIRFYASQFAGYTKCFAYDAVEDERRPSRLPWWDPIDEERQQYRKEREIERMKIKEEEELNKVLPENYFADDERTDEED